MIVIIACLKWLPRRSFYILHTQRELVEANKSAPFVRAPSADMLIAGFQFFHN
jgi:hypothetical protein